MSMTKQNRKRTVILLAVALAVVLSAGGTLAFLNYRTDAGANKFDDANGAAVNVLMTETGWDNTRVKTMGDGTEASPYVYQMDETEYTLHGVPTTYASGALTEAAGVRDANNALVTQRDAATTSSGEIAAAQGGGNLQDENHRAVAYQESVTVYKVTRVKVLQTTRSLFDHNGTLLVEHPLDKLENYPLKDDDSRNVSDLGIVKALTVEPGMFAKKDPVVHNASTTASAYVAIRIAFRGADSSALNTKRIDAITSHNADGSVTKQAKTIVDDLWAQQILSAVGFTADERMTTAPAGTPEKAADGKNLAFNSDDWVADASNGSYGGVYYFYYRTPLEKSTSRTPNATSPLFEALYVPSDAGRSSWQFPTTITDPLPSKSVVGTDNFLDFLMDPSGLAGEMKVLVDAVGVQSVNLQELENAFNGRQDGQLTGAENAPAETALRNLFGPVEDAS